MVKKVAIIGAGPAGLACADSLSKSGNDFKIDVYEATGSAGGLCKTIEVMGQKADLGPHLLYPKYDKVNEFYFRNLKEEECVTLTRLSRIYYKGKFYLYPVKIFDALKKLGIIESFKCGLSFLKSKINPSKENSFEGWVSNAFGYRLYSIFFKPYSEKIWGVKCSELDNSFAQQRMKTFNFIATVLNAVFKGLHSKDESGLLKFKYPKQGNGVVYERISEELSKAGVNFYFNIKVAGIATENKQAKGINILDKDGSAIFKPYDYVVSTAAFTDMVRSIEEVSEEIKGELDKLKYRNTILAYVAVNSDHLFADHWLYVVSKDVVFGRVSNFYNWSQDMKNGRPESLLVMEYWANDGDEIWNFSSDKMNAIVTDDLLKSGLITDVKLINGIEIIKLHRSYPMYRRGYREHLNKVYSFMDGFSNLYFIGRNGSFKYNNQDHSIIMGFLAAEKILGKFSGSLWDVNTDTAYQYTSKL